MTSPEKMNQFNVRRENFNTYEKFLDTTLSLHKEGISLFTQDFDKWDFYFDGFWLREVVDYAQKTVDLNIPTVDKAIQASVYEYAFDRGAFDPTTGIEHKTHTTYEKGLFFFGDDMLSQMRYLGSIRDDDNLEMLPIPSADGNVSAIIRQFAAISSSSKNAELAWRFIKILLNDECQSGLYQQAGVRRSSIDKNIDNTSSLCYTVPYDELIIQLKEYYKSYDNAVLARVNAGTHTFSVLKPWNIDTDDPLDINEQKIKINNELLIWLSE